MYSRFVLALCAVAGLVTPAPGIAAELACKNAPSRFPPAIEDLHRRDRQATLTGDADALKTLWTQDAVRMEPGGRAELGLAAIYAQDLKEQSERQPGAATLSYLPMVCAITIARNHATEWGYFSSSFRNSAAEEVQSFRGKFLRVLRREADGTWKFSHVMWNVVELRGHNI